MVMEAEGITPDEDIRFACETYGTGPNQPEQLLYDCYVCVLYAHPRGWGNVHNIQARTLQEQDLSNNIDKERRKSNLLRKIRDYAEDIRRQVKTKEGIVSLFKL